MSEGITSKGRGVRQQMVDADGDNIGAAVTSMVDFAGRQPFATVFGELQVGYRRPDLALSFQYNLSTTELTAASANGGAAAVADGLLTLSSSVATNGSASVTSVDSVRYRPGHQAFAYLTARFTAGVAGAVQWIGMMDASNGFAIGYNGATLSVLRRKAGVETITARTSWSLDKLDGTGRSGFTLDPTKLNVYSITWGYLGIAPIVFSVYAGAAKGWVPFHVIDLVNSQTTTHVSQPMLPLRAEVVKTSGATDITLSTASWEGGTVGDGESDNVGRYFATQNSKAIGISALTNIFTIKNQSTWQTLSNKVQARLVSIGAASEGAKTAQIRLLKNATLGGTPSYTDIDATNSVMQVDVAGTTVTGGTLQSTIPLGKSGQLWSPMGEINIHLHPGETLTFAAISTAASDIEASCRWTELF